MLAPILYFALRIVTDQFVCKDFGISREVEVGGKECAQKDILNFYMEIHCKLFL